MQISAMQNEMNVILSDGRGGGVQVGGGDGGGGGGQGNEVWSLILWFLQDYELI